MSRTSPAFARLALSALASLVLFIAAPAARADEATLESTLASVSKSEVKSVSSELRACQKQFLVGVADFVDAALAGDLGPVGAMLGFASLDFEARRKGIDLLALLEQGNIFFLASCVDEIDEVPVSIQPGGCGITDWRESRLQTLFDKDNAKLLKRMKRFDKALAKQQILFNLQRFPPPVPPALALDPDLGPSAPKAKPTTFLTLLSIFDGGEITGREESSGLFVLALADPENGATVDVLVQDVAGDEVARQDDVAIDGSCLVQATFEDLPAGVYVVVLQHGTQRLSRAHVVG